MLAARGVLEFVDKEMLDASALRIVTEHIQRSHANFNKVDGALFYKNGSQFPDGLSQDNKNMAETCPLLLGVARLRKPFDLGEQVDEAVEYH